MIKLLDELTKNEIEFAETGCLGVRALGPVLAYGLGYDFLNAWAQYEEQKVTAFITKFYGAVTIYAVDADKEEIHEFLEVIGYEGLTHNLGDGEKFVMKLEKGSDCTASTVTNCNFIENSNFKEFYDIISRCHEGLLSSDFDNWYVDMSHRIRHGTAATYVLKAEGKLVSTVAVLSITENCIFITGVSTLEAFRGKHYAHTLIKHVCDIYKDKSVYLFCKPEKVAFYEKAGFIMGEKIFTI